MRRETGRRQARLPRPLRGLGNDNNSPGGNYKVNFTAQAYQAQIVSQMEARTIRKRNIFMMVMK